MAAKKTTDKAKDLKSLEVRKLDLVKRQRELRVEEAKLNAELLRAGADRAVIACW